jgi:nitrite reductase/ring-hydroxylating ferredoxin subunit
VHILIPDGDSRGFDPAPGGFTGLFAVRQGENVYVYVNSCPHIGVPLDWAPHRFLTRDRSKIICAVHGAEFRIDTGECMRGTMRCMSGALSCQGAIGPVTETCNGRDDNCNNMIDDGVADNGSCGTNEGECTAGTNRCIGGGFKSSWFGGGWSRIIGSWFGGWWGSFIGSSFRSSTPTTNSISNTPS